MVALLEPPFGPMSQVRFSVPIYRWRNDLRGQITFQGAQSKSRRAKMRTPPPVVSWQSQNPSPLCSDASHTSGPAQWNSESGNSMTICGIQRRECVNRCIALGELKFLNNFSSDWKVYLQLPEFLKCIEIVGSFLKSPKLFCIFKGRRYSREPFHFLFFLFKELLAWVSTRNATWNKMPPFYGPYRTSDKIQL